jgi:hypothetical protein
MILFTNGSGGLDAMTGDEIDHNAKTDPINPELVTNSEAHDSWFRAEVLEALNDKSADISAGEVEGHFANRRSTASAKPA